MRALHAALTALAIVLATVGGAIVTGAAPASADVSAAAAVVTGGAGASVDDTADAAATSTDGSTAGASTAGPGFDQDRYVEHRGDVVNITVTVPAGESGTLGLDGPGDTVVVTLADDGDGRVAVRWNTYSGEWSAVDDGDAATVSGDSSPRLPPAGTYQLNLTAAGDAATATLQLRPRSLERVGTWQAPTNETAFESAADVRAALADGTLGRATGVDANHTLVLQVDASGLEGAIAAADGPNDTARFRAALADHGDLVVRQHERTVGVSQQFAVLHVLDGPGVRVLADEASDTYYLVVDVDRARLTRGDDEVPIDHVAVHDTGRMWFRVDATLAADSPLTDGEEVARAVVTPREASVSTAPDGTVHFRPAANQTVVGHTDVGPGWNVTVVLAGEDDPTTTADESFRLTREVTVRNDEGRPYRYDGTFEATFDLQDVPTGARNVTADVRFAGRSLLEDDVPVEVAEKRASLAVDGVDADGEFTAVEATVSLSTGGFVVLHEGSADGAVVGHTAYLDAGEHDVTVHVADSTDAAEVVAVAHRDANSNEWFDGPDVDPAYAAGDPRAVADLDPSRVPTTTGAGGTATASDTPTDTPTPGFDLLAVALSALAVAAALRAWT